jgi:hypothetical protein
VSIAERRLSDHLRQAAHPTPPRVQGKRGAGEGFDGLVLWLQAPRRHPLQGRAVKLMADVVAYCLSNDKPSLSLIHVNALVKA